MRVLSSKAFFILGLGLLVWMPIAGLAQSTCPALVEQALTALGDNCAGLDRNSACYGYDSVSASFSQEVAPDFFTRPADRTALTQLNSVRTAPLDLALEQWGIAVLNVQANVPNTLPGQAVTVMLMGDVAVENNVAAADAVLPGAPIALTTQSATEMLDAPDDAATVLATVPGGAAIEADAVSPDSEWVRVLFEGNPGWIRTSAVNASDQIAQLPAIGAQSESPMQAFTFQTGLGAAACSEAPSVLALQGPENLTVDLSVNGASIQMGSTVTLQMISPTSILIVVHEGHVETADGLRIEQGQAVLVELDEDGNIVSWGTPRPATPDELQLGDLVGRALLEVGVQPGPPENPSVSCGPGVTHTVAAGENLFRIAQRYGTTMGTILNANGLTNANIVFVGQQLAIPCGNAPLPPQQTTGDTTQPQPVGGVDCGPFRATSPLDGLPYGLTTFFWDPAPGALGYRVNIFNLDGGTSGLASSFETGGAATNLVANITNETVGQGFSFAWEVQALGPNGQVACTSVRTTSQRAARPFNTDAPPSCNFNYVCEPGFGESPSSCSTDC